MNLMVVEDDEAIRDLIATTLEGAGHHVTLASDGVLAMQALASARLDAVLLDVNMPRMDGFAVLEALRRDDRTQELPVLMLTAQSAPADIRRAVQLGASDYIGKPFNPKQLLRRLDRMMLRGA